MYDNKIQFIGRIVDGPNLKVLKDDKIVAFATLGRTAVNNQDIPYESLVFFANRAKRAGDFLRVGDLVIVSGTSVKRKVEVQEVQYPVYETSYVVDEFRTLESKKVREQRHMSSSIDQAIQDSKLNSVEKNSLKEYLIQSKQNVDRSIDLDHAIKETYTN